MFIKNPLVGMCGNRLPRRRGFANPITKFPRDLITLAGECFEKALLKAKKLINQGTLNE